MLISQIEHVANTPQSSNRIAVRSSQGDTLTYQQLSQSINQWSHFFLKKFPDNSQEIKIGLHLPLDTNYVVIHLALLKSGLAVVPLTTNPKVPARRLLSYCNDETMPLIITSEALSHRIRLTQASQEICTVDDLKSLVKTMPISSPGTHDEPTRLAYAIYSSGTTGKPKQGLIEHKGILNFIRSLEEAMRIDQNSCMAVLADIAFDAHFAEMWTPLIAGGCIQLIDGADRLNTRKYRHLYKNVTHGMFTPSILSQLDPEDLRNLQVILSTGEALKSNELARWGHVPWFIDGYGPMEVTIGVYLTIYKNGVLQQAFSTKNMKVILCRFDEKKWQSDPNDPLEKDLAPSSLGEIYIVGDGLARSYSDPNLTEKAFVCITDSQGTKHRAFKTGDLAVWQNGKLEIRGRIDRQFKIHGQMVHANELEAIIKDSGLVEYVYVDSAPSASRQHRLVAYVVPKIKPFQPYQVNLHIRENFYRDINPACWHILNDKPQLSNNLKTNRDILHQASKIKQYSNAASEPIAATDYPKLIDLWKSTLELDSHYQPHRADNFLHLGGSSIDVTNFLRRLKIEFSAAPPLSRFLKSPTLNYLIAHYFQKPVNPEELITKVIAGRNSTQAPIIFVHTLLGDAEEDYRKLIDHMRGSERDIYLISAPSLENGYLPEDIPAIADLYTSAIKHCTTTNEPPILVAWSAGGTITLEIANQLSRELRPSITLLLDSDAPQFYQNVSRLQFSDFLWDLYTEKLQAKGLPSREELLRSTTVKELHDISSQHPISQINVLFNTLIQFDALNNQSRNVNQLKTIRSMLIAVSFAKFEEYPSNVHLWAASESKKSRATLPNGERLCWPDEMRFASVQTLEGNHESFIFQSARKTACEILQFASRQSALWHTAPLHKQVIRSLSLIDAYKQVNLSHLAPFVTHLSDAFKKSRCTIHIKPTQKGTTQSTAALLLKTWAHQQLWPNTFKRCIHLRLSILAKMRLSENSTLGLTQLIDKMPWIERNSLTAEVNSSIAELHTNDILWIIEEDRGRWSHDQDYHWEQILFTQCFSHSTHLVFVCEQDNISLATNQLTFDNVIVLNTDTLERTTEESPTITPPPPQGIFHGATVSSKKSNRINLSDKEITSEHGLSVGAFNHATIKSAQSNHITVSGVSMGNSFNFATIEADEDNIINLNL